MSGQMSGKTHSFQASASNICLKLTNRELGNFRIKGPVHHRMFARFADEWLVSFWRPKAEFGKEVSKGSGLGLSEF